MAEPERQLDHTRISIQFQYKGPNSTRPFDESQEENLTFELADGYVPAPALFAFIPAVGDTVELNSFSGEGRDAYKVLTRHFSYTQTNAGTNIYVNIVVTDVPFAEMAARHKE
jgi:hypothetical protein